MRTSPVRCSGVKLAMVAVFLLCAATAARAQNITQIMAAYPRFGTFSRLLSATGVINEVESRKSLTLLVPSNSVLDPVVAANGNLTLSEVGDVIRYHVLLQYLDVSELQHIGNSSMLVTTLYQTTGRAANEDGFVNVTDAANGAVLVGPPIAGAPMQAAILTNITQIPYNYSLYEINGVLIPVGLASAPPAAPTPAPIPAPAPVPVSAAPVPSPATTTAPTLAPSTSPVLTPTPATASPTPTPTAAAPSPITAAPTSTSTPVPSAAPVIAPVIASPPAPPTSPAEAPAASQNTSRPSGAPVFLRPTLYTFALCGVLITLVLVL
ncbi:unnamed protein product [Sphagnum troendelagicum]|uniref:FAS1 domain-containing protein n=1 Tax=Sphagnum troendelagicum TaxID=128251 RepID=A0ABP0UNS8_9BRYO